MTRFCSRHDVNGILAGAALVCMITAIPLVSAKEVRDGSSFERAILVQGDYEDSVDWEWAYLMKEFWEPWYAEGTCFYAAQGS